MTTLTKTVSRSVGQMVRQRRYLLLSLTDRISYSNSGGSCVTQLFGRFTSMLNRYHATDFNEGYFWRREPNRSPFSNWDDRNDEFRSYGVSQH
jgi:hypothetical protein